jgi:hypothetical protein
VDGGWVERRVLVGGTTRVFPNATMTTEVLKWKVKFEG